MKKAIIALFFIAIIGLVAAEAIVDYRVADTLSYNENLTFSGIYTNGTVSEILCGFFVFGLADQNHAVIRLSDEYTLIDGSFYAELDITQPGISELFQRGADYNAVARCGTASASQKLTLDTISVATGTMKMMQEPQVNKPFFAEFRLMDYLGYPISGVPIDLSFYDSRSVKMFAPKQNAISDENGFVAFNLVLPQCGLTQSDNCFFVDENYSAVFTGDGVYREEPFYTKVTKLEQSYMGEFFRFVASNATWIVVIGFGCLFLLFAAIIIGKGLIKSG